MQDISTYLETHGGVLSSSRAVFQQSLSRFVAANEDPSASANFSSSLEDHVDCIVTILTAVAPGSDENMVLLLLKVG